MMDPNNQTVSSTYDPPPRRGSAEANHLLLLQHQQNQLNNQAAMQMNNIQNQNQNQLNNNQNNQIQQQQQPYGGMNHLQQQQHQHDYNQQQQQQPQQQQQSYQNHQIPQQPQQPQQPQNPSSASSSPSLSSSTPTAAPPPPSSSSSSSSSSATAGTAAPAQAANPVAAALASSQNGIASHFQRSIETYGGYDLRSVGALTPRHMAQSKHDLGSVDPHQLIMSLRSGLLLSQSWALNVLTALANDTLIDFPLQFSPTLLNTLMDLLTFSLTQVPTVQPGQAPAAPDLSTATTLSNVNPSSPPPATSSTSSLPASAAESPLPESAALNGISTTPGNASIPPTIHDLLAFEFDQFSSVLQSDHHLHSPATILNHNERSLCIENIFRGFSFSAFHADIMMSLPLFVPTLIDILTRYPLEHRKNGLVILLNVAGKLSFSNEKQAEATFAVLSDCILTQVDAERTYSYFPHPTLSQHIKQLPPQYAGNINMALLFHQQVANAYTYFNWDPFYFSSNALETLVHLTLLYDNRTAFTRIDLGILNELIRKLSLLVMEELEDLEDVDTAEMSLVILSNLAGLSDPIRFLVASQPGLIRSLVRFARFPVLLQARDEADQRQNMNIMRFAAQALLGISLSKEGQAFLKDHEQPLLDGVCEHAVFAPLLSEVLFNISRPAP